MKTIPLTQRKVAIVDDEDYEYLSQFKWHAEKVGNTYYAGRKMVKEDGKRTTTYLHNEIMQAKMVDHKNRDGLDNRKENLRICTHAQNMQNRKKNRNNTSGYIGVTWEKRDKKWSATIMVDKRKISLGHYSDPVEAAKAYDTAARTYHGEFSKTNF